MNQQTTSFVAQLVASMPDWLQWILATVVTVFGPTLLALWKSEMLALDNTTMANGILQGRALARKLLAVIPVRSAGPTLTLIEQIAALESELEALRAQAPPEKEKEDETTDAAKTV